MGWKNPNAWKAYYEKNKEKIKARAAERYRENSERKKAYSKDRYRENPDLVKFEVRRSFLKRKYGITDDQFNTMMEANKGKCPCCHTRVGNPSRWCVDHCHKTNKVRGLICGKCNCALGFVGDDTKTLERMIQYLQEKE